jgi:Protein of unknown function (DUF4058)
MDPYIEACGLWGDFHTHLVEKIYERLAESVPDRYLVRTGERSYVLLVESGDKQSHPFLPDVSVTARRGRKKPAKKGGTAVAESAGRFEPVTMRAFVQEEHREAFVEIYEVSSEQRLVTCIDVLSPSNKHPGTEGWDLYQRKRQSLMLGNVNLVEIDLLRSGRRMPMLDPWPEGPYSVLVAPARKAQHCRVWAAHFRWPLPDLPVPLSRPDSDISLSLQPMIDAIYERSRYARSIDYRKPLTPALDAAGAAWLEQQFQVRGGQK